MDRREWDIHRTDFETWLDISVPTAIDHLYAVHHFTADERASRDDIRHAHNFHHVQAGDIIPVRIPTPTLPASFTAFLIGWAPRHPQRSTESFVTEGTAAAMDTYGRGFTDGMDFARSLVEAIIEKKASE